MYDVYIYLFLFCIHVVVDADDLLCYVSSVTSRSGLLSVVRTFFFFFEEVVCGEFYLLEISEEHVASILVLLPFACLLFNLEVVDMFLRNGS
jgi:hypothetical protein